MVLDPQTPSQYTFGGEVFYSNSFRNANFWITQAHVRLLVNSDYDDQRLIRDIPSYSSPIESGQFQICRLTGSYEPLVVPRETVYEPLVGTLRRHGVVVSDVLAEYLQGATLSNMTEETLNSLPSIQYFIQTDQNLQVHLITLTPREYIHPFMDEPDSGEYRLGIILQSSRTGVISMNAKILKKLVIHFDANTSKVGFGEPLVEL